MPTMTLTSDYRVETGQTLAFNNEIAFRLREEAPAKSPSLTIAGTVLVNFTGNYFGMKWGIQNEVGGLYAASVIRVESTGVYRATTTGQHADMLYGFYSQSWSADFVNKGVWEVSAPGGSAMGFQTYDAGPMVFENHGLFRVSAAHGAYGVSLANGGHFKNFGDIIVSSADLPFGGLNNSFGTITAVKISGYDNDFLNTGNIRAISEGPTASIGVYWEGGLPANRSFVNQGLIEGDYAFLAYGSASSAASVRLTNSGTMRGAVVFDFGPDVLRNSGLIDGVVDLGDGDDVYDGTGGTVTVGVLGAGGADRMTGGASADVLFGEGGNDTIAGAGGDDWLWGGTGTDLLTGGSGADTFIYETGDGADTVTDFVAGADQIDLLGMTGVIRFSQVMSRATQVGADTVIDFGGGNTLTLRNVNRAALTADDFVFAKNTAQDFTGDGEADLLWRHESGQMHMWRSVAGSDGFTAQNMGAFAGWRVQEKADFNGDGTADLLWRGDNNEVHLWESDGAGGFTARNLGRFEGWQVQAAADFNGDGRADILWRSDSGQVHMWNTTMFGFTPRDVGNFTGWNIEAAADFNGDGRADIVWRSDAGRVHLWTSTQHGNFSAADMGDFTGWNLEEAADFNGDGRADFLWRSDAGQVHLWRSGPGGYVSQDLGFVDRSWDIKAAADFNDDGRADIVWRGAAGHTHLWLADANGGFGVVDLGHIGNDWVIV